MLLDDSTADREGKTDGVPVNIPAPVQSALSHFPTSSLSQSLSSSPRISTTPARANRDSLQRKQLWWLPYVVLEFDKNEVLVDALGGDLAGPVWMYSATFDVSRISEISIVPYLRTQQPGSAGASSKSQGQSQGQGGEGKEGAADMGNSDLCLGGIRFTPDLETNVSWQ
jgi:serum/glucocorticoid-regulated kinase 2